jgi:hypothetical protein
MNTILEPEKKTPVIAEYDLVVIGGSCTGVFAAIRAARRGLSVGIIENFGYFGGTSTARLVNVWHSTYDLKGEQKIIGGLSLELLNRLAKRGQTHQNIPARDSYEWCFNSAEMSLELDKMVLENNITPYLHTKVVDAVANNNKVEYIIIEDKSGRRAIKCAYAIDASGDADLLKRLNHPLHAHDNLQPATTAGIIDGFPDDFKGNLHSTLFGADAPDKLKKNFIWASNVPGCKSLKSIFGTRIHNLDASVAEELTTAEIEGRDQLRLIVDRLQNKVSSNIGLAAIPAGIGIRDTRHIHSPYQLKEMDVLEGVQFEDSIAHGTYRVDIHPQNKSGITFRYLDGREESHENGKVTQGMWREKRNEDPLFYSIPFRSLQPNGWHNILAAGRCLDADRGAFGAVRVMILCNQMGEAAGEAVALASSLKIKNWDEVESTTLRNQLNNGGSLLQNL